MQKQIFQGAHGIFLGIQGQQHGFTGTRQLHLDLLLRSLCMWTAGHRFHLQEQAITQFFGGVFVTSHRSRDVGRGGFEQHPQQPGSLADAWRGSQQRQTAAPEWQASEDSKGDVGLRVAQGSRARHAAMIFK